jgi:TRAP-type C4-dicarboxylate transport system substrate-binding protein
MLRRALPTATFALTLPAAAYAERRPVHVLTASHSSRVAAADFAREVEGKTAGRVTVQPFLSGQRGAEPAPLAFSELFFAVPQGVFDT